MAGKLNVDAVMEALNMPSMTLQSRIKSLCVRVKWVLSQGNAQTIFEHDELNVLFAVGCKELNLSAVIYSTPDDYFKKIHALLGRELNRFSPTTSKSNYQAQQEESLIKRVRTKLDTLDALEKFYLSEWIVAQFAEIEHQEKLKLGVMHPKKQQEIDHDRSK